MEATIKPLGEAVGTRRRAVNSGCSRTYRSLCAYTGLPTKRYAEQIVEFVRRRLSWPRIPACRLRHMIMS